MTDRAPDGGLTRRPSPSKDPIPSMLEEAAATLKRLPKAVAGPRLTSWPEVVRDSVSLLAPADGDRRTLVPPSPQAIDRMDRTLCWLLACDDEARRLVWARANRIPWRKLEDIDGRSHVTLRKIVSRGHDQMRVRMVEEDMKKVIDKKKPLYRLSKTG